MRGLLLAFALGVLALQQRPELPPLAWSTAVAIPLAIALVAGLVARRATGHSRRAARAASISATVATVALAGFFYAAWRAELRLADQLPSAWEGREIELRGVIDDLPQPVDRGLRFAFAVERVLTAEAVVPPRLSLSWYESRRGDAQEGELPKLHAGERWQLTVRLKRPHG